MPRLGISSLVCFMLYPLEFFLQLGFGSKRLWMWPLRLRLRPVVVAAIIQGARDGSTHSQAVASFGAIFALKSLTVHVKFLVFLYIIAVAAAFPCFPCKYVNVACKFCPRLMLQLLPLLPLLLLLLPLQSSPAAVTDCRAFIF